MDTHSIYPGRLTKIEVEETSILASIGDIAALRENNNKRGIKSEALGDAEQ